MFSVLISIKCAWVEGVAKHSNTQLKTYTLNMNKIVKLSWVQDFDFHQFDNINVVPEPATMLALGAGLTAFVARRRK